MKTLCFIFVVLVAVHSASNAQMTNLFSAPSNSISLEVNHPTFVDMESSILSGVYNFEGKFKIGPKTLLSFNLPYSTYSLKSKTYSGINNIKIGAVIIFDTTGRSRADFNLYLPTASSKSNGLNVNILSFIADFLHYQQYLYDYATLQANIGSSLVKNGFLFGANGGLSFSIPSASKADLLDNESVLFAQCTVTTGYENQSFRGHLNLNGIANLTSDVSSRESRIIYNLSAEVQLLTMKNFRPSLGIIFPLSNPFYDIHNNSIILKFEYILN